MSELPLGIKAANALLLIQGADPKLGQDAVDLFQNHIWPIVKDRDSRLAMSAASVFLIVSTWVRVGANRKEFIACLRWHIANLNELVGVIDSKPELSS
jgi:hypothetical protein